MPNYNPPKNKVQLTAKQESYLRSHYQHTKNEELAKVLGISPRTVIRRARDMGLRKSRQFMNRVSRENIALAHEINERSDYSIQRRWTCEQWKRYREAGTLPSSCFKAGEDRSKRFTKKQEAKRLAKSHATRCDTLARDRRRIRMGLEPLTNVVKSVCLSNRQVNLRSNMRKHGYLVFRSDTESVYFDGNTLRSKILELHANELEILVRHISERGTINHVTARVDARGEWCDL